jgi:xanthine/CO dehydrogenase XdhC/CoxF family maturation factor
MDLAAIKAALALIEAGERFALVSTLETKGSSPRHSGAAMIVRADGSGIALSAEPLKPRQ